jgi:nucleoside-diphosphate-sugar epimerase
MSESYLVTGARGCIGAWVVRRLAERGSLVTGFDQGGDDRILGAVLGPALLDRVPILRGDVTDAPRLGEVLAASGASRIIHLAGLLAPACRADPVRGVLTNVVGTLNVFEAAERRGASHVVYASSASAVGDPGDAEPVGELSACNPSTHYAVYKKAIEDLARVHHAERGLPSVGVRPSIIYGVGRESGLTADLTKAMKAAHLGRPFHIRFDGTADVQYADDVAAAFIACADASPDGAVLYNLHGETTTIAGVVDLIEARLPQESQGLITYGGPRLADAAEYSDRKIREALPGLPATPLAEGIERTLRSFADLRAAGRLAVDDLELRTVP